MGKIFDTLYFNVAMIWVMSFLLYAALYYELLKKGVHAFEMRRKYYWRKSKTG
jgi:ABC transport system ATP-binding/permease protein